MIALRDECDRLRHLAQSASAGTPLEVWGTACCSGTCAHAHQGVRIELCTLQALNKQAAWCASMDSSLHAFHLMSSVCVCVQTQVTVSLPPASAVSGAGGSRGEGGGSNEAQSKWHEAPEQQGPGQRQSNHAQQPQEGKQQQQRGPEHEQGRAHEPPLLPHIRGGAAGGSALQPGTPNPEDEPRLLQLQSQQGPEQAPDQGRGAGLHSDDASAWEQYMDWVGARQRIVFCCRSPHRQLTCFMLRAAKAPVQSRAFDVATPTLTASRTAAGGGQQRRRWHAARCGRACPTASGA